MKKRYISVLILGLSGLIWADISTLDAMELELQAEEIRKELNITTPTIQEKRLEEIRAELNLDFDTSSKDALLGNNDANSVQPLGGIKEEKSLSESFSSAFSNIKERFNEKVEGKKSYSFSNSVDNFYDTVGLDKGDSFGMPSIFGMNEKPKKKSMNIPILSDVQSASTSLYKGMKHSGQSAELMSGMMYNSSKLYNTMFGLFDDSPFNIFDGEDKKKSSIFDIFD